MLITYFKDPRILARYRSGLASIYSEDFITWLESQGYRRFMIRRHVRGVVHFTDWAEAEGLAVGDLDRGALNRLCSQLEERKSLRNSQIDSLEPNSFDWPLAYEAEGLLQRFVLSFLEHNQ